MEAVNDRLLEQLHGKIIDLSRACPSTASGSAELAAVQRKLPLRLREAKVLLELVRASTHAGRLAQHVRDGSDSCTAEATVTLACYDVAAASARVLLPPHNPLRLQTALDAVRVLADVIGDQSAALRAAVRAFEAAERASAADAGPRDPRFPGLLQAIRDAMARSRAALSGAADSRTISSALGREPGAALAEAEAGGREAAAEDAEWEDAVRDAAASTDLVPPGVASVDSSVARGIACALADGAPPPCGDDGALPGPGDTRARGNANRPARLRRNRPSGPRPASAACPATRGVSVAGAGSATGSEMCPPDPSIATAPARTRGGGGGDVRSSRRTADGFVGGARKRGDGETAPPRTGERSRHDSAGGGAGAVASALEAQAEADAMAPYRRAYDLQRGRRAGPALRPSASAPLMGRDRIAPAASPGALTHRAGSTASLQSARESLHPARAKNRGNTRARAPAVTVPALRDIPRLRAEAVRARVAACESRLEAPLRPADLCAGASSAGQLFAVFHTYRASGPVSGTATGGGTYRVGDATVGISGLVHTAARRREQGVSVAAMLRLCGDMGVLGSLLDARDVTVACAMAAAGRSVILSLDDGRSVLSTEDDFPAVRTAAAAVDGLLDRSAAAQETFRAAVADAGADAERPWPNLSFAAFADALAKIAVLALQGPENAARFPSTRALVDGFLSQHLRVITPDASEGDWRTRVGSTEQAAAKRALRLRHNVALSAAAAGSFAALPSSISLLLAHKPALRTVFSWYRRSPLASTHAVGADDIAAPGERLSLAEVHKFAHDFLVTGTLLARSEVTLLFQAQARAMGVLSPGSSRGESGLDGEAFLRWLARVATAAFGDARKHGAKYGTQTAQVGALVEHLGLGSERWQQLLRGVRQAPPAPGPPPPAHPAFRMPTSARMLAEAGGDTG